MTNNPKCNPNQIKSNVIFKNHSKVKISKVSQSSVVKGNESETKKLMFLNHDL